MQLRPLSDDALSYSSLFDYCVKNLNYSESGAFLRIRAARAAAMNPRVIEDLRTGLIHLDTVMRIYPHLTNENSNSLLDRVSGASKREVMEIVAQMSGETTAPERDVIRFLPSANSAEKPQSAGPECMIIAPPPRVRLSFTADDTFLKMVKELRALRRHKFPEGRLEDLLKDAVESHLHRIDPARRAMRVRHSGSPAAKSGKKSRRIPAAVKAAVWKRDQGRCSYFSPDGRRCESRDFLEYDHLHPWALGGASDDSANIRLLCRPHNQRLARRRFGPRSRRSDSA